MNELGRGYSTYAQHDRHNVTKATFTDFFSPLTKSQENSMFRILIWKLKLNDVTWRHCWSGWVDVCDHFENDSSLSAHPGEGKTKQTESKVGVGQSNAYVWWKESQASSCGMTSCGGGDSVDRVSDKQPFKDKQTTLKPVEENWVCSANNQGENVFFWTSADILLCHCPELKHTDSHSRLRFKVTGWALKIGLLSMQRALLACAAAILHSGPCWSSPPGK